MNRNCSACHIKIDTSNYLKDRSVCESYCDKKRRKNNNNTSPPNKTTNSHQQSKIKNVNKNKNRTLLVGFSGCGKAYLMNDIVSQKQEPHSIITKSLNQYPNIKAQTSDEIQSLENYENSIVVFDDILLSKQESNIDLFFTRVRHNSFDNYYVSQSYFHLPKNTIPNDSNTTILFKQFLRDVILLFHEIARLDMNLEEWKGFCRKACENDFDYSEMDRFAKIEESGYTIRICIRNTYTE